MSAGGRLESYVQFFQGSEDKSFASIPGTWYFLTLNPKLDEGIGSASAFTHLVLHWLQDGFVSQAFYCFEQRSKDSVDYESVHCHMLLQIPKTRRPIQVKKHLEKYFFCYTMINPKWYHWQKVKKGDEGFANCFSYLLKDNENDEEQALKTKYDVIMRKDLGLKSLYFYKI